jgi:hypothetical protein
MKDKTRPAKPDPVFEVMFVGENVLPENIPLATLSQSFTAIQRLAAGPLPHGSPIKPEEADLRSVRLLDVRRGSAIFRFYGLMPQPALERLETAGRILKDPESIGDNDYILSYIKQLSGTARHLDCKIVVRKPGKGSPILARIGPESYREMTRTVFITGETSIIGHVQRVGNVTGARCGLHVPFQERMLICKVAHIDVARKLGEWLYQRVQVQGTARWLKKSWRIVGFTIKEVKRPKPKSILEAMEQLRNAGGADWDKIEDPAVFLSDI